MASARSLSEFQKAFPDEARCVAFLFQRRWPDGFVCPCCGKRRAVALKSRPRLYECLDCGRQTSITAGTALHRSKLPLTTWFWAAHLMATHSNGMSARQLEDRPADVVHLQVCVANPRRKVPGGIRVASDR
jgi:transposase-like protein